MTNNSQDWRNKADEAVQRGDFDRAYIHADWASTLDAVEQEQFEEIQQNQQEEE